MACIAFDGWQREAKRKQALVSPRPLASEAGRRPGQLSVSRTATVLVEGPITVHNRAYKVGGPNSDT
jgi:hypothetical protein